MKLIPTLVLSLTAAAALHAQTGVTLFGSLSNFDVLNDTGRETYGFEIEIQGPITSIGGSFSWNRYGTPQVVPFAGGVYVRYMAQWDAATQKFNTSTPVATNFTPTTGHQCVMGTPNYQASGCEHFGVWTIANPNATIYRWLLADPNNPGKLIPNGTPVAIPAPAWVVLPPAQPADPPIVAADVVAPVPPAPAYTYGDAQWVKVFKTENRRQVGLDELVADNPVVPQDAQQVESPWYLLQNKIGGNGKRNQKRNQGALGNGNQAVVRRFEFYKFSGTYDPITHEAICADGLCNAPAANEVGDFIGAQNAAANLQVPAQQTLTVNVTGNGTVDATPGISKCASACTATANTGTVFTLTARVNSGSVFVGWGGACQGTATTCTVTLDSSASVTATFKPLVNLSIGLNGKGSVFSNPAGISCGVSKGSCSTKFAQGSSVTLTATPDAGAGWTGWGGACSAAGAASACTVTLNADTSVQANFR
jgi:Divergent InlB B-repeat domain